MDGLLISLQNAVRALNMRLCFSIQVPAPADRLLACVDWDSAKAVRLKLAVACVGQHYIANLKQRFFVLIHVTVAVYSVQAAVIVYF